MLAADSSVAVVVSDASPVPVGSMVGVEAVEVDEDDVGGEEVEVEVELEVVVVVAVAVDNVVVVGVVVEVVVVEMVEVVVVEMVVVESVLVVVVVSQVVNEPSPNELMAASSTPANVLHSPECTKNLPRLQAKSSELSANDSSPE